MKRILPLLFFVLFNSYIFAQISGTKTIPGDYPTIAAAIADINANGAGPGGVIYNIAAGYSETIAATLSLTVTGTASNPIIFQKSGVGNNPVITAFTTGTGYDGIWRLVGCDYVTIDGIDLLDPNSTNPATMEYGYGMFKLSATNGCQHNTIKNCVITLSRNNNTSATLPTVEGSCGIMVINALAATPSTAVTPTTAAGTNSYNQFYGNTLQNCNYGIAIMGYAAPSPYTLGDTENDIGGTSSATGNNILNFGGATGATNPAVALRAYNQWGMNISYNTINNNNGGGSNHTSTLKGIYCDGGTAASISINNNKITLHAAGTTADCGALRNQTGASGTTNTVTISGNEISGCTYPTATSGSFYGIYTLSSNVFFFNNRVVNNTQTSTTGSFTGIAGSVGEFHHNEVSNNTQYTTSGSFSALSGSGTTFYLNKVLYNTQNCTNGTFTGASSACTNVYNNEILHNAQNCNYGNFYGLKTNGSTNIYNNTITDNKQTGINTLYGIYFNATTNVYCYSNNIKDNMKTTVAGGRIIGISAIVTAFQNKEIHDNIITGNQIQSLGILGKNSIYGIHDTASTSAGYVGKFYNNEIGGLSITGATTELSYIYGINLNSITNINLYQNKIQDLKIAITGSGIIYGIFNLQALASIYKNKLADFNTAGSSGKITGICFSNNGSYGGNGRIYNNIIGYFHAPSAGADNAIRGISIECSIANDSVKIYYNTICLNSNSSAALFGSSAVYAGTGPHLTLCNNILINTSVAKGAGITAAYRRSNATLTTYETPSNNNYFYAGNPGPGNLIYYDGTVTAQSLYLYKTTVDPCDSASKTSTAIPGFLSLNPADSSFLHINGNLSSFIESGGKVLAGFDEDIDGNLRSGSAGYPAQMNGAGTMPDIGADEFDGFMGSPQDLPYPGNTICVSNSVCSGQTVTVSVQNPCTCNGITYQWESSSDGTTYTPISGANLSTYSFTYATPLYFKCLVTCPNGPNTAESAPIQIITPTITGVTNGARCGAGPVTLQASSSAGAEINWYSTLTGGSILATGASFITPSLSATTTYYVEAAAASTQTSVSLGNATTTTYTGGISPYANSIEGAREQYLVRASELTALGLTAGNIASLAFRVAVFNGNSYPQHNFTIKMAHTANTALTGAYGTAIDGFITVYSTPLLSFAAGWNTYVFSTPFDWDGVSNILIDVCHDNDINNSCANCLCTDIASNIFYTATSFNSCFGSFANNVQNCGNTASNVLAPANYTKRPDMAFVGNTNPSCTDSRIPVVADISASVDLTLTANQTVCNNLASELSVISPLTNYDSYVWEPVTNLFTDVACTIPYTSGTNAATVYVKSDLPTVTTYTCNANNSATSCTRSASSEVTVLPSHTIAAYSRVSCQSVISEISTSPVNGYGNATFQWQSSTDNVAFTDISGANSLNYTTPPVTSTMYYRLVLKVGPTECSVSNVSVIAAYIPQVLSTTPTSRCGAGSVTLAASGSAASTLNWYPSPVSDSILGTGTSFTTPVLTATTTYYVGAENTSNPAYDTIGNSNTVLTTDESGNTPFVISYEGARSQYLIRASELAASGFSAGVITKMTFHISYPGSGLSEKNYTIKMAHTADTEITGAFGTPAGAYTTVYFNAAQTYPSSEWYTFTFSTPFYWDGISNVLVDICHDNDVNSSCWNCYGTYNAGVYYTPTAFNSCFGSYAMDVQSCGTTAPNTLYAAYYTRRPNMVFEFLCFSPRIAVVATIDTNLTDAQFTSITTGALVNFTNTSTHGNSYLWDFNDGTTSTLENPSHTYSTEGTFHVMLISVNGCNSDTVYHDVTIVLTDIPENTFPQVEIYPNPVDDELIVALNGNKETVRFKVINLLGQVVFEGNVVEKTMVKTAAFLPGVYFIKFETGRWVFCKKFIKE